MLANGEACLQSVTTRDVAFRASPGSDVSQRSRRGCHLSRLGRDDYGFWVMVRFVAAGNGRSVAMADAAHRQRRLAAKVARRKAVVAGKRMLEASSASLVGRIRVAAKGSVVRCMMSSTLFEIGIGHVIVARALPSGLLGCAYFLLDVFCLGVKDVFYAETRVCPQLSQTRLAARWMAARKLRAVLS